MRAAVAALCLVPITALAQGWPAVNTDIPAGRTVISASAFVATNAALKLVKGSDYPNGVRRQGFIAAGDGGTATYYWSATNCTAADDGAQVQPSGTGCWIADFGGTQPTPRIWGAKGDGTTNDSAAVQAAITARQGDILWLGEAIYRLNTGVVSTGRINIKGVGGGQGIYNDSCSAGLRYGAANIDILTLQGGGSMVDGVCIDSPGFTNTSGRGIYVLSVATPGADGTVLANNQINRACIGIEITAASGQQLISAVASHNTIVPPNNTACRGARIGAQSNLAKTTDTYWLHNPIYCGPDTNQNLNAVGVEINDSGGITYDSTAPYGCSVGTKIFPGTNQNSIWGFYYGGLGDTSWSNDLLMDTAAASAAIFGNQFIGTWAATSRGGPSVTIKSTGGSNSVSGNRFVGHRTYTGSNNYGFEVLAGANFELEDSVLCASVATTKAGVLIGGNAMRVKLRNNTFGQCDTYAATQGVGIRIETTSNEVGIITGNDLTSATVPMQWAAVANASAIVDNNLGVDNTSPAPVASATAINVPTGKQIIISGTTPIQTITPTWSGRELVLISNNAAGVALNTGGNFCNSVTATQLKPVDALWNPNLTCWLLR